MRKLSQADYEAKLKTIVPTIECLGLYKSSAKKVKHACTVCGYCWDVVPSSFLHRGYGCPKCNGTGGNGGMQEGIYVDRLFEVNPNILFIGPFVSTDRDALHNCLQCGEDFEILPANALRGRGCSSCSTENRSAFGNAWKTHESTGMRVQGFETFALDYLKKSLHDFRHYTFKISEGKPVIQYVENGKTRKYFPDFYRPFSRTVIEVKSTYTFLGTKEMFQNISAKRQACVTQGYKFKLLLMSRTGRRLKVPINWWLMPYEELHAKVYHA
jgi:hypothetical protein